MRYQLGALQPDPERQAAAEEAMERAAEVLLVDGLPAVAILVVRDGGGISIAAASPERLPTKDLADFLLEVALDLKKMMT